MIGRDYFARQAMTLLRLARLTCDPRQSAAIAARAAELKIGGSAIGCRERRPWQDTRSMIGKGA